MKINLGSSFMIPAAVLALTLTLVPAAAPDVWDKKTNVQFREPVEFPGGVVVPAGGYVMRLMDSLSNRHIVQVLNADQDHVYATILALAAQRSEAAEKTIITFYETPRGDPQFIHKWFYPGDTIGQEFPYPRGRTHYIARANTISGPAGDTDQESDAPTAAMAEGTKAPENTASPSEARQAAEPAPDPEAEPSPSATAIPASEPQAEPEPSPVLGQQGEPAAAAESRPAAGETLPQTASIVPEVALAGGLFIFTALVLAITRRVALRNGAEPPEGW